MSESDEFVPFDPTLQHFRVIRVVLAVEGIILLILGVWGIVAGTRAGTAPQGAQVLIFRVTWGYGAVLTVTGTLALLCTR
ncbi:MAG: hypothetical protein ACRDRL_02360, partial [Sciscionella sp.]